MHRSRTVEEFLKNSPVWQTELAQLCEWLRSSGLEETVKWGVPVYRTAGKNVVGVCGFKSYFGLWFFQGALLSDPLGKLINAQEGRTQAQRQWRFTSARELRRRPILSYVREARALAEQGVEVKPRRNRPVVIPPELSVALHGNRSAGKAFQKLGLTAQREYADYISSARQAATKQRRLAKILPLITAGCGLNDHYRGA